MAPTSQKNRKRKVSQNRQQMRQQNFKCFQPIEAIVNLSRHDGENRTFHELPKRVPE
jgi:hypothetical protein